jgi:tetratricopeptide (TPR) repeat protein
MAANPRLRLNLLYGILIFLTGALIYANSLQNPFIYDDDEFIVRNPYIHHLSDLKAIVFYHPKRWVGTWSFAFNYALGGLNFQGYHAVNILIHLCCGLLVWYFLCLILSVPKFSSLAFAAEKEKWAFWAALLFVTHPVQTMAVDHITQRYTSLAALFYLTSLSLYLKGRLIQGRAGWGFILAAGLAAYLGIFTRETDITLPLAVLLCEAFLLDGFKKFSTDKTRFCLSAGMLIVIGSIAVFIYHLNIVVLLTQRHYYSQSHQGETITAFNYFLTQFRVILIYIRLMFWPVSLNFDYDMPLSYSFWEPDVAAGCVMTVLLFIYAFRVRSQYPIVSFGIFWIFLTLSVESSIFPIAYVMTEYRLYLPLFGFCAGFVFVMSLLIKDRRAFAVVMGAIVLFFSILTVQRNRVYGSEVSLWQDTISKSPYKSRPYTNLGTAYLKSGDYPKALTYLNRSVALEPVNYETLINLADLYQKMGDLDKAIAINERLLLLNPKVPHVYNNLGVIYFKKNDFKKAEGYFYKAVQKAQDANHFYEESYLNLANAYQHNGKIKEAESLYLNMLSQNPREYRFKYGLLVLYLESNEFSKVDSLSRDIFASDNNDPKGLVNLGSMVALKGNLVLAFDYFTKAISIDYACPEAYIEMGKVLYNQHKWNNAIHVWQVGLEYVPNDERLKDLIVQAQRFLSKK